MNMKKSVFTLLLICGLLCINVACKNKNVNDAANTQSSAPSPDLITVAKDIITEVIVRPDSLGDPWEIEKVRNFNGKEMFTDLLKNIYDKKVTVYDIITGDPLDPKDVKEMEKEFESDVMKIGKIQFLEDWYFNPSTNKIIKKIKSASFGYESYKEKNLPVRYKALFRLNIDQ
jgi:hypothetical protein